MFRASLGAVLLASCLAGAESLSSISAPAAETKVVEPSNLTTGLAFHGIQYLDRGQTYFRDGAANTNSSFMFQTSGNLKQGDVTRFRWDIDTEYSAVENWNYFRPHEAYVSFGDPKTFQFSTGRKRFTYSNWDEDWNTPLFESRFTDDKLRTSKAGLIGFFAERESDTVTLRAAFAPIYIPDMGPNYWVGDDIKFHSKNPWFNPPRSSFFYRGVSTNIDYSVAYPDVWSVIYRPGGSMVAEWKPSRSTFSRLSYGYLPMPGYLLKFDIDGHFQVPGNLAVDLVPRFLYHHVANYDFVYTREKNEFGLSVAADKPMLDTIPDGWESQTVSSMQILEGYYKWTMDEARTWETKLSALRVWGGDLPDAGPAVTQETLFERRIPYTDAASVQLSKIWRESGLMAKAKALFDYPENGMILSGDFSARLAKGTSFYLSYDFFQIFPGTIQMTDGFIDIYRGNDRIMTGLSHVF